MILRLLYMFADATRMRRLGPLWFMRSESDVESVAMPKSRDWFQYGYDKSV